MFTKYKLKINQMIDDSSLRAEDYKAVLKILSFLNNPVQRDENIELTRKCSVLVKRKISEMTVQEVCALSEVSEIFCINLFLYLKKIEMCDDDLEKVIKRHL